MVAQLLNLRFNYSFILLLSLSYCVPFSIKKKNLLNSSNKINIWVFEIIVMCYIKQECNTTITFISSKCYTYTKSFTLFPQIVLSFQNMTVSLFKIPVL